MTADEMQQFVNGLSDSDRVRLAMILRDKRDEMKVACAYSMTARLV